eukprot:9482640-Pyramimonas_sp.AAC.1
MCIRDSPEVHRQRDPDALLLGPRGYEHVFYDPSFVYYTSPGLGAETILRGSTRHVNYRCTPT